MSDGYEQLEFDKACRLMIALLTLGTVVQTVARRILDQARARPCLSDEGRRGGVCFLWAPGILSGPRGPRCMYQVLGPVLCLVLVSSKRVG